VAQRIAAITLLVRDYDEAIAWFTERLGFELAEDTPLSNAKRWVRVAPPGGGGASLLLAKAASAEQTKSIGKQGGGRVLLFLETDDFQRDYAAMKARGVVFREEPRAEDYGTVAVFEDFLGNRWDLVQPRNQSAERRGTR
jgi:catechol 2,3-dioxygenase-like lactoylglutathione lyase family enzyme